MNLNKREMLVAVVTTVMGADLTVFKAMATNSNKDIRYEKHKDMKLAPNTRNRVESILEKIEMELDKEKENNEIQEIQETE